MCNLSQGIFEKGEAKGEARGEARVKAQIVMSMYKKGLSPEQIANLAEMQIEEVEAIIQGKAPALVTDTVKQ